MPAQLDWHYIRTRPTKLYPRLMSYVFLEGRPLTTSGRWFNPVVFGLYELAKRLPEIKKVEEPVFILGTGRSGSTIFGKVLSMHPHIAFLNEPKALWHAAYPHEDVIGSYTLADAHYRLDEAAASPTVRQQIRNAYGYGLALTAARRILDKYPELIFRIPFVQTIFPDAKFIFLSRNGWDTVQSITQWSLRKGLQTGQETHDWWGVDNRKWHLLLRDIVRPDPAFAACLSVVEQFDRHEDMAAVEWIATMREALRWQEQQPGLLHHVRYEDLLDDPRTALAAVFEFCNLPSDEVTLDYAESVLTKAEPKPPGRVHPAIEELFAETNQKMGY